MRVETSAMDEWIASFTAMRVALGGATTRRKTLQPAPPQPTMATRARSSPTPSLHVSGTPADRHPTRAGEPGVLPAFREGDRLLLRFPSDGLPLGNSRTGSAGVRGVG